MSRLSLVVLGVVATLVVALGAVLAATRSDARVTVVYVAAHDCTVCPIFERETWKPFLDTDLGRRVAAREVKVRSFVRTNQPAEWPDDLRWMIAASEVRAGTPTVLVFKGDRLAARGGGHMWATNLHWRIWLADLGWFLDPRSV